MSYVQQLLHTSPGDVFTAGLNKCFYDKHYCSYRLTGKCYKQSDKIAYNCYILSNDRIVTLHPLSPLLFLNALHLWC